MSKYKGIYQFAQAEDFKYAIIAHDDEDLVHVCLYPNKPTTSVLNSLIQELDNDEDLGLVGIANYLDYTCKKITKTDYPNRWKSIKFDQLN